MRYYPFTEPGGGNMTEWDVHFRLKVIADPNGHDYLQTENGSWYSQNGSPNFNTANYYPIPPNVLDPDLLDVLYPTDWAIPFSPFYANNEILHPPPFSLLEAPLLNNNGSGYAGYTTQGTPNNQQETFFVGNTAYEVAHTYLIDKPLDLRIINPQEQVIYNPSHAVIQMDAQYDGEPFIFPSGYTFKTVHGVYPSAGDVATADPDGMYGHPDLAPVPSTVTGNPDKSLYVVEADQHLIIEPCVTIISAKIQVMPNGTLTYYHNAGALNDIDVNWQFEPGSVINDLPWTGDLDCPWLCYTEGHYDEVEDVIVNTSGTWSPGNLPNDNNGDDVLRLAGDLVFEAGAIVDMNNIDIEFGPKGRMIVQRGAEIHATDVKFTAACSEMWEGIQVWGTRNASQSQQYHNPDQGVLIMDACSLEYARLGVSVYRPDTWEDFSDYNGGILHADNTVFRNNHVAVEISPTENWQNGMELNNRCHFGYSQFITDDYLLDPAYSDGETRTGPPAYVKMEGVRGVSFYGCTLSTTLPDEVKPHHRGTGINAQLSTFSVYSSTFNGLSEGILGQGTTGSKTARIRHNTFTNTIHNIVLENLDYAHVVGNTIDLPESPRFGYNEDDINKGMDHPVGLFFLGSTFFHVEGNSITATEAPETNEDFYTYAMVVDDAGEDGTNGQEGTAWIYRNTIDHFGPDGDEAVNIGIQCERNNQGYQDLPEEPYGLFIECNTFEEQSVNDFDITVVGDFLDPGFIPGSLRDQGLCDLKENQAGNQFSSCGNDDEQVFFDPMFANSSRLQFEYQDQVILQPDLTCSNTLFTDPCPPGLLFNPCDVLENCGKPCIEPLVNTLMAKVMVTEDELALLTDSTEIVNKQKELGYIKGKVLLYQNMLMHEALMFESIDSAIARGWERIDEVKEAKLAALYKEKGDLAKADSLVQVLEEIEGTPSEQTEVLKLEVEKAQQNKDLKDIDDTEEQALEDKIEEDPGGAHASKVVLEYARRRQHTRSPLPLQDSNPGYRHALEESVFDPAPRIIPNPTDNQFRIILPNQIESVNVELLDIAGRKHRVDWRIAENDEILVNPSELNNGIYLVVINLNGNIWKDKVLILR